MKATKFVLCFAMISFVVLAYSESEPNQRSVKIKLIKALENPGLVQAMHQQLDLSLLNVDGRYGPITARVVYNRTVYFITGKYLQWKKFFLKDLEKEIVYKKPAGKELASRIK